MIKNAKEVTIINYKGTRVVKDGEAGRLTRITYDKLEKYKLNVSR